MHLRTSRLNGLATCLAVASACLMLFAVGCGGSSTIRAIIGFSQGTGSTGGTGTGGVTSTGVTSGSGLGGSDRSSVDPCLEAQSRKFIRISMRNLAQDDYIHYFLVLVAYVSSDTYPDGAVCEDDIQLYTSYGYVYIPEGSEREFGNFCFIGPALLYFHESGQFETAGGIGGTQLASAIEPARGSVATYDAFFTAAGGQIPVPDQIIFHNPGTGDGARLKVSRNSPEPCGIVITILDSECEQDAFYYVDEYDSMAGTTALGPGSGRRVPNEIQDTGCTGGFNDPWHQLAPSGVTANNAFDYEFLRGGKIEFAFVREDTDPAYPQLVWRVTDSSGAVVHDFDPRAGIP